MPTRQQLQRLVSLEYDLADLATATDAAIRTVQASGLAGAAKTCRELHLARRIARRALSRLSRPIAELSRSYDSMNIAR